MPSGAVDTRVVEMQFDSKDFDKNIRKSQKTLEDFKQSLNFEDAARQMSVMTQTTEQSNSLIAGMAENIKKLTNELAGFGNIGTFIAKQVKKAWEGALKSVGNFVKGLTTDQVSEGTKKYEKLLKSVQTIKNATGDSEQEVYSVMEKLNKYTDETSYNFADMAQNISKFTTVGIGLKDAEEEMEGIANWAAFAGQGATEASRAMYNISQAMSAGAMLKMDWKSIQNAGMDTRAFREEAIKAAVAVGTLVQKGDKFFTKKGHKEVNMDNFAETLSLRWFDKAAMEKVFKTFADNTQGIGEQAYKAAQRCTTLTDAVGAWKDMLSTGWMKTYEAIFGKLTDAMNLFSGLCNKVSESLSKLVELRNGILTRWSLGGGRKSLWGALFGEMETPDGDTLFKGAYGLLDALQDIGDKIMESFWGFVRNFVDESHLGMFDAREGYRFNFIAVGLQELTKRLQEFTNSIGTFLNEVPEGATESRLDQIGHVAEAIIAAISLIFQIISGIGQFAGEIIGQLQPAIDAVGYLIGFLSKLFTGSVVEGAKKNVIGNFFHSLAETLKPVTTIINYVVVNLARLVASIFAFLQKSGLLNAVSGLFKMAFAKIGEVFAKFLTSDMFKNFIAWIQNLSSNLPGAIQKIKDFFKSFGASIKGSKTFQNFWALIKKNFKGKNFKEVWANIKTGFSDLIKRIPELLPQIKDGIVGVWEKIKSFFDNFFGNILGFFVSGSSAETTETAVENAIVKAVVPGDGEGGASGTGILQKIKDGLAKFFEPIKNVFNHFFKETIPNFFQSDAIQSVKNFFKGVNLTDLLDKGTQIMKWLAIFKTGSGIGSMGKGIKSLGKGIKVFGKNLKNLNLQNIFSGMFNISNIIGSNNTSTDTSRRTTFNLGKLGNQLLLIAGAIWVVVDACKKLASFTPEELQQAGISLGVLITSLLAAGWAAKKFTGNGGSLLALSLAVLALILPLKILIKMPWVDLLIGVGKLFALMLMLALAARVAKSANLKGLVGFAIAVTILIIPLKALMKVTDRDALKQGLISLGVIMLFITGMAAAMGATKFTGFKGMISMAASLLIIALTVKMIGKMQLGEAVQGVVSILSIMTAITAMVFILRGIDISSLSKVVVAVTALSAVGWLIGHTMNWQQALIGFVPIIALIGMMTLMFKVASDLEEAQIEGIKNIFVAFTSLIAVIAGSILALSTFEVDLPLVITFMVGVVAVLGMMGLMLHLAKDTDEKTISKITSFMIVFTIFVAITGAALVAMSVFDVKWDTVLSFVGCLALLLAMTGVMVKLAEKTDPKAISRLSLILGILSVTILAFGAAIVAVSVFDVDLATMATFFGGIILVLTMTGVMVKLAAKTDQKKIGMLALLLGVVTLTIVGAGFALVELSKNNVDWKVVLSFLVGLAVLVGVVGVVMPLLAKLSLKGAVIGAVALAAGIIAIMGAIALVIPWVLGSVGSALEDLSAKLKLLSGLLKDFFDRMESISDAAVEHAKSVFLGLKDLVLIFSGFGSYEKDIRSVMTQLALLGTALDLFFVNDAKYPSVEKSNGMAFLQKMIEIGPSIAALTFGNFPQEIFYLGVGIGLFNEAVKNVSATDVPALALLQGIFGQADNIEKFTKLPLETFTSQMTGLGGAMSLYAKGAKEVTGLEPGEVPDISQSVEILKGVAMAISGEDGSTPFKIPSNMPDSAALGLFAGQLEALGNALSTFATAAKDMETDTDKATALIHFLAEIGGYVTEDNLKVTKVFDKANVHSGEGTGTLGQFALDIGALGTALATFADNVKEKDFSGGLSALSHLQEINSKLTKDNISFANVFKDTGIDNTVLGQFALDIGALGHSLASFAQNVTLEDGTPADFDNALKALNFMVSIRNRLPNIGGLHDIIYGQEENLGSLGTDMEKLGGGLRDFSTAITGAGVEGASFNYDAVVSVLSIVEQLIRIMNALNVADARTGGWLTAGELASHISSFVQLMTDEDFAWFHGVDGSFAQGFAQFAKNLSDAFGEVDGINVSAIDMFSKLASSIVQLVTLDPSLDFKYPGTMIAEGIAQGIYDGKSGVVQAAVDVVQAAIDAANETADAHSPSRVFAELGQFMDKGLANGMLGGKKGVESASGEMVDGAIDTTTSLLARISQAMADNTDLQPKITPVLDLSNLEGAGTMIGNYLNDGWFGLNLGDALTRAASAARPEGPAEVVIQNPTDLTGVVTSIDSLQARIDSLNESIRSMKIYLNSGEVAGGITDDIDYRLGLKSLYEHRRN